MSQMRPAADSIENAWPRQVCPTDDDADGLRFLYPECEEMLACEMLGGADLITENMTSGCRRFTPHPATGYSIIDYYAPPSDKNWSHPNVTWAARPLGRTVARTPCVKRFKPAVTVWTASYRAAPAGVCVSRAVQYACGRRLWVHLLSRSSPWREVVCESGVYS